MEVEGTHKRSSAPTEGCGKTKGTGAPWRSRREWQGRRLLPFVWILAHCSLALGQRDQCEQTDRGEKGPPESQHSWTPSGCGDELERLRRADSKEACSLFEDLELLPEQVGVGVGLSVKGWSGRVSCVDQNRHEDLVRVTQEAGVWQCGVETHQDPQQNTGRTQHQFI